jgi:hypothetical protein
MVRSFNRICKVDYDNIVAVALFYFHYANFIYILSIRIIS